MASMIGSGGFASLTFSVPSSGITTFADMGFTDEQIAAADMAHISVYNQNIWYWYSGEVPAVNNGHRIMSDGERIVRSIRNIRNFQMIAQTGNALVCVTLAAFGRAPL